MSAATNTRSRAHTSRRLRGAFVVAALLLLAVQVHGLACAPTRDGSTTSSAGNPTILSADTSAAPARPVPERVDSAATRAARAFVHDYAATLRGSLPPAEVRSATASLRARIAAANVHATGDGGIHIDRITVARVAAGVVRVSAVAHAGSAAPHLRFVLARTPRGWLVDDIADPESP